MVQSQSITRFDAADVVALMDADEARTCVAKINGHMNSARALLLDLYERRGWAALGYTSWRECVTAEFEESERTLYYALQAAQIERNIRPVLQDIAKTPIPETQLRPLATLTPMEQPIAWQEANERTEGKPTAKIVEQVVKEMIAPQPRPALVIPDEDVLIGDGVDEVLDPPFEPAPAPRPQAPLMAVHFTSNTAEWYTPHHIVKRVIDVFGEIDLDPCSNSHEAANVPASEHFTQADDGLAQQWHGRIYMNPPYGDEISQWTDKLLRAYQDGEIDEAIALLPARTDTAWFRPLMKYLCCFVHGRLKFSNSENSAPFPSVVVYLGPDKDGFADAFADIGTIMQRAT